MSEPEDEPQRYTVRLHMQPLPWWAKRIYRRRGMHIPLSCTPPDPAAQVPYAFRDWHERYARAHHYYWLPCVLCTKPHGGHEISGEIPDPIGGPSMYVHICPACTAERNGGRV